MGERDLLHGTDVWRRGSVARRACERSPGWETGAGGGGHAAGDGDCREKPGSGAGDKGDYEHSEGSWCAGEYVLCPFFFLVSICGYT